MVSEPENLKNPCDALPVEAPLSYPGGPSTHLLKDSGPKSH